MLKDNWYFNTQKSIISNDKEEFVLTKKKILFLGTFNIKKVSYFIWGDF